MNKTGDSGLKISLVLQPYTGNTSPHELSIAPELIYTQAVKILKQEGIKEFSKRTIQLTDKEKNKYGVWNRMGLANSHLGFEVAPLIREKVFVLGLLGNCNSLSGMLAGLQNSGKSKDPLSVGLIWLDAHGDFNTPETTLSGWLGGMPVTVAAGKCLHRLRKQAGLNPPLSTQNIIMMGVRDLDPLEEELIFKSSIPMLSIKQISEKNKIIADSLTRLSNRVEMIYVHIDLDVLDAAYIPGHNFEVSGGLTPDQLSEIIEHIMQFDKVKALGIASFPTAKHGREKSMDSTSKLIKGAIQGLKNRRQMASI
jgi:arginase